MEDLTKEGLLTLGGNAVFVALTLQLIGKGLVEKAVPENWRDLALNVFALLLGIGGAFLAQGAFGVDYASAVDAILVGVGGAALAVFGYEAVKNVKTAATGT